MSSNNHTCPAKINNSSLAATSLYVITLSSLVACAGPQSGLGSSRSHMFGTYSYTAERRIDGVVHTFHGTEEKSFPRLPASQSVVHWTDLSTGAKYTTTVKCLSGWLSWLFSGEDCLDAISSMEHSIQLPGD